MSKVSICIIICVTALGFVVGSMAGKSRDTQAVEDKEVSQQRSTSRTTQARSNEATQVQLPYMESEDSLETITAKGLDCPASEMALWLVDASAADIAAYWDFRSDSEALDGVKRVMIYNWVRTDLHAAMDHLTGTDDLRRVFWTWGILDPETALEETLVREDGEKYLKNVVNGIGQMQNQWLIKNFDRIPEKYHRLAFKGLRNWPENPDQVSKLNFLLEHDQGVNHSALRMLTRQDPWAAYEWLAENNKLSFGSHQRSYELDVVLESIKNENIDVLDRIAASAKSDSTKRKIEDILFTRLVETDLDAAMRKAKSEEAPLVTAKRLGEIGLSLIQSDSEKAFEIGRDIFTTNPESLTFTRTIGLADGSARTSYSGDSKAENFIESLLAKDPERTMDMAISNLEVSSGTYRDLSQKMLSRDVDSYANWVNSQNNAKVAHEASFRISDHYTQVGQYSQAADWLMRSKAPPKDQLKNLLSFWQHSNPEEARKWVESASIDEGIKQEFLKTIQE